MFLVLAALIVRPVGFKFRSKLDDPRWRGWWDWALCIGGIVPPLVFGIAFGNLFTGADRGNLIRFYNISSSPERRARLRKFYEETKAARRAELRRDGSGWRSSVLLRNHLDHELQRLDLDAGGRECRLSSLLGHHHRP